MKNRLAVIPFLALFLVGSSSFARHAHLSGDMLYTMYQYPTAQAGACIVPSGSSPASVFRQNGITYRGAPSPAEVSALAKGIGQIQRLLGRPIPASWQTTFNFINTWGHARWNEGASAINVRRPRGSHNGENVGRFIHELGHRVGNAGAYEQYRRFTGGHMCSISGYALTKRNEQFAEVFAAYVTYPDRLRQKCPGAYRFFAERLFPGSASRVASCSTADRLADRAWRASPEITPASFRSSTDRSTYLSPGLPRNGVR